MQEVEVGFKIKQSQKECEKLLENSGYEFLYQTETHDIYFTNKELSQNMTEQQLKFNCVRFRHSKGKCGFDNFKLFKSLAQNRFKCTFDEAVDIIVEMKKSGFKIVFDTFKTDCIYKKGNAYHQLQNIDKIGLLDYFYNEDIFNKSQKEQFETLTQEMLNLGFSLEYEEGVDKLRSLLLGKLCFSKNQNGDYQV